MKPVHELLSKLIACPSVSPKDEGCQALIQPLLDRHHFRASDYSKNDVSNVLFTHGTGAPFFLFAGHTDVVPAGPLELWHHDPFTPYIQDNILYGRGAADMKSAVAAMSLALCDFVNKTPDHKGTIALLLTSDEEAKAVDGTRFVVEQLKASGNVIDYCVVGEPSSDKKLADTIRIGRRGSLTATLTIIGKQGHVAYPHLANNPIHLASNCLADIIYKQWDERPHEYFPPTSCQIVSVISDAKAGNVIPGTLQCTINWRYSPATCKEKIAQALFAIFKKHSVPFDVTWRHSGKPYLTPPSSPWINTVENACKKTVGYTPSLSTSGGTSDGRFIADICDNLIELGVINDTIHQVNECVNLDDVAQLQSLYLRILQETLR